jgi:RNA polymerase sigma factor (sigma-70 family)
MTPLLSAPLLRTQSDRRLAVLAADGHDRAFEAIVERYRRPLERYLRRLLSEPLAEDVLQASFVRAWQALRAGTDVRDLRPWLYRIAHNQALNTLRAAGAALPAATEALPAASLEAEVEQREELRETLHGIRALPERQRAALVAVAVADRAHADVAAELGMSDGALRQLLLRARTTLRAAATALTPYPLMTWLAGGQEATAARIAEVAVGAGGAGVAVKAGAAALAAGAVVVGGPALRSDHAPTQAKVAPAAKQAQRPAAPQRSAAVVVATADHQAGDQARALGDDAGRPNRAASKRHSGPGRRGGGSTARRSDSSGRESSGSGSGDSDADEQDSGSAGSGSSGSESSGSSGQGSSGKGDSGKEHSGKSGVAIESETEPAPVVRGEDMSGSTVTTEPEPSHSGEGSDSSGSGDGGDDGSGSSGPG